MKYILPCLLLSLLACSKSKKEEPPPPTQQGFKIEVKQNRRLSTGEFIADPAEAIIHVWSANNRSLEIKSASDAVSGYAWDNTSNKSVKADYTAVSYEMLKNCDPGQYYVFVALKNKLSYSTISFSLNSGGAMSLKKVFTTHAVTASYEEWFAKE